MRDIETKVRPNYQQPHSIHYHTGNEALNYHLKNKDHRSQKYNKSKWNKRLYTQHDKK